MALADKKFIGGASGTDGVWSTGEEWIKVEYDFDNDTGAIADYDVLENDSGVDFVITDFYCFVETAATSGTDFDIDLGIDDGGTEIWSDKAKAGFAINTIVGMDTAAPVYFADGTAVVMGIETATATAGKWHMYFKLKQLSY
jgi:hypothetical protein